MNIYPATENNFNAECAAARDMGRLSVMAQFDGIPYDEGYYRDEDYLPVESAVEAWHDTVAYDEDWEEYQSDIADYDSDFDENWNYPVL